MGRAGGVAAAGLGLTQSQLHRAGERFEPYPTIVVCSTDDGDGAGQWLRAGQALQWVLLAATVHGLAATPMSQPLEVASLRELVTDTASGRWAQVILRLGYAEPATPRRRLAEVLMASSSDSTATSEETLAVRVLRGLT